MKVYKGTDKDIRCKGYQFTPGVEAVEDGAKLCVKGFHACEAPLDVLQYYAPGDGSRYFEAELEEVSEERRSSDSKVCGKRITLGAEIGIPGLIKAQFEYVKSQCSSGNTGGDRSALTGGDRSALTGGDRSALTGGDRSALTGGDWSALTGGNWSALTGGYWSALTGGYRSALTGGGWSALTGGNWSALTGGYWSALTGGYSSALTGGDSSALTGGDSSALTGGDRSALRGGVGSRFRGGLWSVFACEIRDKAYNLVGVKAAVVDGENIKPNVWYILKDGEFVEADNAEGTH